MPGQGDGPRVPAAPGATPLDLGRPAHGAQEGPLSQRADSGERQPAAGSPARPRAAVTTTPIANTSMATWKAGTAIRWIPLSRPL